MRGRMAILDEQGLLLADIQEVIASLDPLPGALDFLGWLRERHQVLILSDTFYQFALPLMRKLGFPTLFANDLEIDPSGRIAGYRLRMADQKRQSVEHLRELNFQVIAAGDSYNDTSMLKAAHAGILFRPPANVVAEFPQFPVTREYAELQQAFADAALRVAAAKS